MAEAAGRPPRLHRPPAEQAVAIEHALRQVPCPFVGPLRFAIRQVGPDPSEAAADDPWATGDGPEATGEDPEAAEEDPRRLVAAPAEADLAVAVELPQLTGAGPGELRDALAGLLAALGTEPPAGEVFLDRAGWWVSAGGAEWFATVHADSYPDRHSRHWPRPGAIVVLVPRLAFDSGFPAGVPDATRQAIRSAFARRGVRYPVGGGAIANG